MKHRNSLPQLDGGLFLTDGGIETTLIFHEGLDLPLFAAFDLLKDDEGTEPCAATSSPTPSSRASAARAWCSRAPRGGRALAGPPRSAIRSEELDGLNRRRSR